MMIARSGRLLIWTTTTTKTTNQRLRAKVGQVVVWAAATTTTDRSKRWWNSRSVASNDDDDDTNSSSSSSKDGSNDLSPLVVCGPAGIGTRRLVQAFVQQGHTGMRCFGRVVSHTTRAPRSEEVDGIDFHFVSRDSFEGMVFREEFLEHVTLSYDGGTLYGTSMQAIYAVNNCNDTSSSSSSSSLLAHVPTTTTEKIEILDMNVAGVQQLKAHAVAAAAQAGIETPLRPKYLFVAPKSLHVLRRCLIQRRIDDQLQLQCRCNSRRNKEEQQQHMRNELSHESDVLAQLQRLVSPIDTNNRVLADALDRQERRIVQQAVLDMKYGSGQTKAFDARIVIDPLTRWDEAVTDFASAVARLYPHLPLLLLEPSSSTDALSPGSLSRPH
jgi:guanylate kinase